MSDGVTAEALEKKMCSRPDVPVNGRKNHEKCF